MAGSYCQYCDLRCFVFRQVIVGGEVLWSGHMATCRDGAAHDRMTLGRDHATATSPVSREPDESRENWGPGCSAGCGC
jgi:hypothetical protein